MTRMRDLSPEMQGKILTRVPITSLEAVRSTSKLWESLSKDLIVGEKSAARQHKFLGFMTLRSKVCSLRFDLEGIRKDGDMFVEISQVALFDQVEISQVLHLDGLVLCVTKDSSGLFVWNPYLGQTRCIGPRTTFGKTDRYALGYDSSRNYKILRVFYDPTQSESQYEVYDLSYNSWRQLVLDVAVDWSILEDQRGVALKGNTYFFAQGREDDEGCLLCFDFTRERFGQRLGLPFYPGGAEDTLSLSCVREEQLAALFQEYESVGCFEIWVTNKVEPNAVSWSKFLVVDDMSPLAGLKFHPFAGSFFICEEDKVAVVFDVHLTRGSGIQPKAYIIGEDGYFKSVSLGDVYFR